MPDGAADFAYGLVPADFAYGFDAGFLAYGFTTDVFLAYGFAMGLSAFLAYGFPGLLAFAFDKAPDPSVRSGAVVTVVLVLLLTVGTLTGSLMPRSSLARF